MKDVSLFPLLTVLKSGICPIPQPGNTFFIKVRRRYTIRYTIG
jgi:hypothetical protein